MNFRFRSAPPNPPLLFFLLFFLILFPITVHGQDSNQKQNNLDIWYVAPSPPATGSALRDNAFARKYLLPINPTVPQNGQSIPGSDQTWTPATASNNKLKHKFLKGGYAYKKFRSNRKRVLLAYFSGNYRLYVNGQSYQGDVYANRQDPTPYLIPILLRKGPNHLFVHARHGVFAYKFARPQEGIYLSRKDATLPDVRAGKELSAPAGFVIMNTSSNPLKNVTVKVHSDEGHITKNTKTLQHPLQPAQTEKVPIDLNIDDPVPEDARDKLPISVEVSAGEHRIKRTFKLDVKAPDTYFAETFRSPIDDSVQYYGVTPPSNPENRSDKPMNLVLTLHGANVEATGLVNSYTSRKNSLVVAPTNRRPFGFDWEDWGRKNALHTLEVVKQRYNINPDRIYLSGHSMGGHGVYHVGVHHTDQFATLAPSAGWVSLWDYGNRKRPPNKGPNRFFYRTMGPSDTLSMKKNLMNIPLFIIHGDEDNNVPLSQAKTMVNALKPFHENFVFHVEKGKGHWWDYEDRPGATCVNMKELFQFFRENPRKSTPESIHFTTWNPGISSSHYWIRVQSQKQFLNKSTVDAEVDPPANTIDIETKNISFLSVDPSPFFQKGKLTIVLNGQEKNVNWKENKQIHLRQNKQSWKRVHSSPAPDQKHPDRYGPFQHAFDKQFVMVYGTEGTENENRASLSRAKNDASEWRYKANGRAIIIPDSKFSPEDYSNHNVILYGHADMNSAFDQVLDDPPLSVKKGKLTVGDRSYKGKNISALYTYPRTGTTDHLVGVVGGTGADGIRSSNLVSYFRSGRGFPDVFIFGSQSNKDWEKRNIQLLTIGVFGPDWNVDSGEFWHRPNPPVK